MTKRIHLVEVGVNYHKWVNYLTLGNNSQERTHLI